MKIEKFNYSTWVSHIFIIRGIFIRSNNKLLQGLRVLFIMMIINIELRKNFIKRIGIIEFFGFRRDYRRNGIRNEVFFHFSSSEAKEL